MGHVISSGLSVFFRKHTKAPANSDQHRTFMTGKIRIKNQNQNLSFENEHKSREIFSQ